MILLESNKDSRKPETYFHRGWDMHVRFLVQDETDCWYSGSPANLAPGQRLLAISSYDLSEVMDKVAKVDGGLWPPAEFINGICSSENVMPYINRPLLFGPKFFNVLAVFQEKGKFGAQIRSYQSPA